MEQGEPTGATGWAQLVPRRLALSVFEDGSLYSFEANLPGDRIFRVRRDGPDGEVLWEFLTEEDLLSGENYMGFEPLPIFADGFESGHVSVWATVESDSGKIGGQFR